jgi:hypothetical protein
MKRIICALLSACMLLCLTGCSASHSEQKETQPGELTTTTHTPETTAATEPADTAPTTEATEPGEAGEDSSLVMLRQAMVEMPPVFAVAYFGYTDADPLAAMQAAAPALCEDMPFLLAIPEENRIGTAGHLFCIVPADENASVAVNRSVWNGETETYEDTEVLYRSESGTPILVLCPNENGMPDTEIIITDSEGTVAVWDPHIDSSHRVAPLCNDAGESLIYDFSPYDMLPDPDSRQTGFLDMVGTWDLKRTEVEGDTVEAETGVCTLQIDTDGTGFFWISYRDNAFPEDDFTDRELLICSGELYPGCGNDTWFATVYQTDEDAVGHAVTLLEDGTLLMQHSWQMDGMPMVSYGWFQRNG